MKGIAQDSHIKMSFSTVKRFKFKIKAHGSIMREEGSGKYQNVIRDSLKKLYPKAYC